MIYDTITVGLCENNELSVTVDFVTGKSSATSTLKGEKSPLVALMSYLNEKGEKTPYHVTDNCENCKYTVWEFNNDVYVYVPKGGGPGGTMPCTIRMSDAVTAYSKFSVKGCYTFHNVITCCHSTNGTYVNEITFDSVTVSVRGIISARE